MQVIDFVEYASLQKPNAFAGAAFSKIPIQIWIILDQLGIGSLYNPNDVAVRMKSTNLPGYGFASNDVPNLLSQYNCDQRPAFKVPFDLL